MLNQIRHQLLRFFRGLSEFGAILVWPIEKATQAITHAFFVASESVSGFFDQVLFWIAWPFRALLRLLGAVFRFVVPEVIRTPLAACGFWLLNIPLRIFAALLRASELLDFSDQVLIWIAWPFRALLRLLGAVFRFVVPEVIRTPLAACGFWLLNIPLRIFAALLRASEFFNLDRPILWLVWLLQPLWRPFAAVGGFAYAWWVTRQWRQMLWGIPALLMLLPFAMVWAHSVWVGKGAVISRYQLAVKEALKEKDYDRYQLFERKLAQLGVDNELTEYRTALALAEEEKLDEAYERMQLLTPEDQPGYAAAHFWIIQRLMSGQLVEDKEESRRLSKAHLDHLKTLEITGQYYQLLQAIWLAQGNQLEEAATALKPLVSTMPNAAFDRMRIGLALNRPEQARQDARALVTHMSAKTRRGSELNALDCQWWLAAEEVLGNLQQMRTILDQWHELEPDSEVASKALATVCRRQAAQLLRGPLPDQEQIVELWLKSAELDHSTESLFHLARAMYRSREQTPIYKGLLEVLRKSPRTPANLLVAMGTEAASISRYDEARDFLAAAVARDDTNPVAWNNYGLVLGEGEDPQLDEALTAVNRSLKLAPDDYHFRETRGQIFVKLERWPEAVKELEFALNGLPNLEAIHRSLATAYAALGQDELAQLHVKRVE